MRDMAKSTGLYARLLLYLLVGGYVLLLLAGLIPERAVMKNIGLSAVQMEEEGYRPTFLIGSDESYRLNNYAETRMMLSSLYMNTRHSAKVILINPTSEKNDEPIDSLSAIAESGALPEPDTYLAGSLQGWRAVVRVLLSVMNIRQIRRLTMWAVLLLFAANVLRIAKHSSPLMALLFATAFLSVNPLAIMSSMQYATCFLIAFTAMLLMPDIGKWCIGEPAVFFLIGGLTQFFDLYSYPILTFGLPVIVRLLVKQREGELLNFRDDLVYTGKCFLAWLSAYVLLLAADVGATCLFTDFDALAPAWAALTGGIGIGGGANPVKALLSAVQYLSTIECAVCLVGFVVAWPFMMDTRARRKVGYKQGRIFLLVALLPALSLMVASGSAIEHGYYQYRALMVSIFAALCFYAKPTHLLEKNMKKLIS